MNHIIFLSIDDVLLLHKLMATRYGGIVGLRDRTLLESAIAQPEMSFGGQFVHESIFDMAAAYCFHIIKNHPFIDGNKRAGLMSAVLFLEKNGYQLAMVDELYEFTLDIASSRISKSEISEFFRLHSKSHTT